MRQLAWLILLAASCGTEPKGGAAPHAPNPPTQESGRAAVSAPPAPRLPDPPPTTATPAVAAEPTPPAESAIASTGGRDFTAEARALLVVGACASGEPPSAIPADVLARHCKAIRKVQGDYTERWVGKARAFFASHVPAGVPRKVVYPFAGGDLSTALTVYPDADEITTISLEPAGDPRDLGALDGKELVKALATIQSELKFLYKVNFSNTMNMISAMRGGRLPTQLVFGLSALTIHGYEVVAMRYFKVLPDGALGYLEDADLSAVPAPGAGKPGVRNRVFGNVEIQFRKPGGRTQVYRHIQQNLDNPHLEDEPNVLRHLEAKGQVVAMTKAASYLLSFNSFSKMRDYLTRNAVWMVSDATGVAPKWGKPSGFEYETYGTFAEPHMNAGKRIAGDWRGEFERQPARVLPFRFGYPDRKGRNHLIIMRRKT
jgi:hypothetical protein